MTRSYFVFAALAANSILCPPYSLMAISVLQPAADNTAIRSAIFVTFCPACGLITTQALLSFIVFLLEHRQRQPDSPRAAVIPGRAPSPTHRAAQPGRYWSRREWLHHDRH